MEDYRFPVSNRLLDSTAFQKVFSENRKIRDRYWIILTRQNGQLPARLGMAIAKKNVRKAVERNKIKRLVREIFRVRKDALVGLDIVVLVSQAITELDKLEQRKNLNRLFDKLIRQKQDNKSIK